MMMRVLSAGIAVALLLVGFAKAEEEPSPTRWQKTMDQFKKADAANMPAPGGVLFIGSSSIRLWKLDESFPGRKYINRGFGGSHIADSTYYADDIVFPYQPTTIVMYAGGNDVAQEIPPAQVAENFRKFAAVVHKKLPKTRIVFISIKASTSRWKIRDLIQAANKEVEEFCAKDERLIYVDAFHTMLGKDGLPQDDLLRADKLHLSDKGYKLWTSLVEPHLPKEK